MHLFSRAVGRHRRIDGRSVALYRTAACCRYGSHREDPVSWEDIEPPEDLAWNGTDDLYWQDDDFDPNDGPDLAAAEMAYPYDPGKTIDEHGVCWFGSLSFT
jgi:hypothetical protein